MATTKFLGIDSVNVLKKYIDEQILLNESKTRVITLQIYKYVKDGEVVPHPERGSFDPEGSKITYPEGWASLDTVLTQIGDITTIEAALREGSIYMSAGVAEGGVYFDNWSTPVKISGQNGINIRFAYSNNPAATEEERTDTPSGVDSVNTREYVWTNYAEEGWQGPSLWAVYAKNASEVLYRYCVTATMDMPAAPSDDTDSNWSTSISNSLTNAKPYMWMTWKRIPACDDPEAAVNNIPWNEPILFGHYAKDGNVPNYSMTLYTTTDSLENSPEFVCTEGAKINDVLAAEANAIWSDLPGDGNESTIWWYVVINVNGPEETVINFSNVKRYSAIDGVLTTASYTKYMYCYSPNQLLPAEPEWIDTPVYDTTNTQGSLWMKVGIIKTNTITGETELVGEWSEPVRITGPRGPIAYDYRQESRYGLGSEKTAPKTWTNDPAKLTPTANTPYIWEKRYIAIYRMKEGTVIDENGNYNIVQDGTEYVDTFGSPVVFRISGLNGTNGKDGATGANGNRQNTIEYTTEAADPIEITDFFQNTNYFIANSSSEVNYVLVGDRFEFDSGYTGKFVNIGTANMVISVSNAKFVGSATEKTEPIIVKPQEIVELITLNNNGKCEFILIGKPLVESEPEPELEPEPGEDPIEPTDPTEDPEVTN